MAQVPAPSAPPASPPVLNNAPTPTVEQAKRALDLWLSGGLLVAAPLILVILFIADMIRPGSFQRGGLRGVQPHPAYVWLFAGLIVYMSAAFGASLVLSAPWLTAGSGQGTPRYSAIVAMGYFGTGAIAGWIMCRLLNAGAGTSGLKWEWRDILVGLGAFVLIYPIVYASQVGSVWAYQNLYHATPDPLAHETLKQITGNSSDPWTWVVAAGAILGAPIVEEILYRGMLQSAVLRVTGGAWSAIIITSVAFAAMHYSVVPPHVLPVLFVLSVGLGATLERTKRLGASIVVHVAYNALNIALAVTQ
ncbi:MAG: CPBP family intramembrane glutamic endopeptidase [Planctomycetota bacterium]|nr:CPBP family intramembrane glutamic endopeptidase [Planctomycetota bacterium]